jgi:hypothetical protein
MPWTFSALYGKQRDATRALVIHRAPVQQRAQCAEVLAERFEKAGKRSKA